MSVIVSHEDVQVRFSYENDEGEMCDFNWLQLRVCHSTIVNILGGLGVKGMDGESYSAKVDDVIEGIAQWDGDRLDNGALVHKPTDYQVRLITKLGMLAMGCKVKGIDEISWG